MKQWQRVIVVLLLGSGLLIVRASHAEPGRPIRIGALTESWGPTPSIIGLRDGLIELGYREDEDFFLGVRFTQGDITALPAAARELIAHGVTLMFTVGVNPTKAARGVTQQIPIVFSTVDDPIAYGLVKSYARPGANITGVTDLSSQLGPKRLQLFTEMVPDLKRVLFPYDASDTAAVQELQNYRHAAQRLAIEMVELPLRTRVEAQTMLTLRQEDKVQGFLSPRTLSLNIPGFVLQTASERKIPAMFPDVFYVEHEGGLASYGVDIYESGKLAARLADKILKGANPALLPVEVNPNIEFAINLKAARALGLTIPPEILFQATKVIR